MVSFGVWICLLWFFVFCFGFDGVVLWMVCFLFLVKGRWFFFYGSFLGGSVFCLFINVVKL